MFFESLCSQTIYSKAFGDPNNEPIIYLHGGPGYNSIGFEVTTAQNLPKAGFMSLFMTDVEKVDHQIKMQNLHFKKHMMIWTPFIKNLTLKVRP